MAESIYRKPKYFDFNLLPEQSIEDIRVLEERDDSTLYAFVLVFSGMFIFFILNLIQLIVIDSRINLINSRIDDTEGIIESYNNIRSINGQIFQKSSLLREPLEQDIKLSRLIEISTVVVQDNGSIVEYGRQPGGEFSLLVETTTYEKALSILNNLQEMEDIQDPYLNLINENPDNGIVRAVLIFNITKS